MKKDGVERKYNIGTNGDVGVLSFKMGSDKEKMTKPGVGCGFMWHSEPKKGTSVPLFMS